MSTFIKIAWRNITRNRARSAITISAVAFGLTALIFIRAFVDGADYQMVENFTDLISGHVQIHRSGFHKKMGLERSLTDSRDLQKIVEQTPGVAAAARRIKEHVLISSAENSAGILLMGIDPDDEKRVTTLHEKIRKGEFLKTDKDIVLGKDLVDNLNARLGDKIVMMGQGADGSLAAAAFRLVGVMDTGAEEADQALGVVTLSASAKLFVLEDKVSEIVIRADSLYNVKEVVGRLKKEFSRRNFEVLPWNEISPVVAQWVQFDRTFLNVILVIVLMVVAGGIMNTILMGVMERTREFGIMLALGTKRRQVLGLVTLEAFFLGLIGSVIGLVLGAGLAMHFHAVGIDLAGFSQSFEAFYIGSVIYPRIFWGQTIVTIFVVLVISTVTAIYPAVRAAGLKPVEAIRQF